MFFAAAPEFHGVDLGSGAAGNSVQPMPDPFRRAHRTRFPQEHQKRGLKRVIGIVDVAQHPPARAEDHGAMPSNQPLEGGAGITVGQEPPQQFSVADFFRQISRGGRLKREDSIPRGRHSRHSQVTPSTFLPSVDNRPGKRQRHQHISKNIAGRPLNLRLPETRSGARRLAVERPARSGH